LPHSDSVRRICSPQEQNRLPRRSKGKELYSTVLQLGQVVVVAALTKSVQVSLHLFSRYFYNAKERKEMYSTSLQLLHVVVVAA